MADILTQLTDVFREVFEDESLVIDRSTTAADVTRWDSLMHVTLILKVERAFGVRFSSREVALLNSVGELEDLIATRRQ
jgi:acyl carrier protein